MRTFLKIMTRLTLLLVMSSATLITSTGAKAHELQPTIADFTFADGTLDVTMRVNIEALLSGIDLDGLADTNDAENVADYDDLRALPAAAIISRASGLLARWNALPMVKVDGEPVALQTVGINVPDGQSIELPRVSDWELTADIATAGSVITVTWPDGAGDIVVRQQGVAEPFTGYLSGGQTSEEIAVGGGSEMGGWQTFASYIPVGFDHILPKGLDHILFVLGLFFLSTQLGPLIWQISAFTLAHTVTLALGALGWVNIPGSIVEPLIAASIVYVAVENIFASGLNRWRPLIVFGFGLLHGLGFASVLGDFGLPQGQFLPALIGFNIGVELGQLTVIALAAGLLWIAGRAAMAAPLEAEEALVRQEPVMFRAVSICASLLIAIIAVWWVIERVFL